MAEIVAVGVNTEGQREVPGVKVGPSDPEPFRTEFLRSLNRRGLRGVKLVVSDSHEGIKASAARDRSHGQQKGRQVADSPGGLIGIAFDWFPEMAGPESNTGLQEA